MINTLLGIKRNMVSTYDARGRRVGATMIEVNPNITTQIKSTEGKDGYNAIQLGFGTTHPSSGGKKSVKKPQIGHAKKVGLDQKIRWFREVRIKGEGESVKGEVENIKLGTEIKLDQVFSIGDVVKVTGTSKGKGFAGVVKRHGFHGGPKTHGQSDRHRAPGSIGSGTTPGRVYRGKKMAGHMGNETVSVKNLEIVGLDKKDNLLIVKGGIPGPSGSLVKVKRLGVLRGYTPPPEEKPEEKEEVSENSENQKSDTPESSEKEEVKENAS